MVKLIFLLGLDKNDIFFRGIFTQQSFKGNDQIEVIWTKKTAAQT